MAEQKGEMEPGVHRKRIPIFRRMGMPLSELEAYYQLQRNARFDLGKRLGH